MLTIVNGIQVLLNNYISDEKAKELLEDASFERDVSLRFEKELLSAENEGLSGDEILDMVITREISKRLAGRGRFNYGFDC